MRAYDVISIILTLYPLLIRFLLDFTILDATKINHMHVLLQIINAMTYTMSEKTVKYS